MAIVEISYQIYNPRNPKCRSCKFWKGDYQKNYSAICANEYFKGRKDRTHNAKACIQFELKPGD